MSRFRVVVHAREREYIILRKNVMNPEMFDAGWYILVIELRHLPSKLVPKFVRLRKGWFNYNLNLE